MDFVALMHWCWQVMKTKHSSINKTSTLERLKVCVFFWMIFNALMHFIIITFFFQTFKIIACNSAVCSVFSSLYEIFQKPFPNTSIFFTILNISDLFQFVWVTKDFLEYAFWGQGRNWIIIGCMFIVVSILVKL